MTEQQAGVPAVPGVTRWRKRSFEVEAVQLTPQNGPQVWEWADSKPHYAADRTVDGLTIYTRAGHIKADFGDWIIRGGPGDFWPRKPDIFAATYELADATLPVAAELERPTIDAEPADAQSPRPVPRSPVAAATDAGEGGWRERAEAAEGKLTALRRQARVWAAMVPAFGGLTPLDAMATAMAADCGRAILAITGTGGDDGG